MALLRINLHPTRTQLRVFAAGCLAAAGLIGWAQRRHGLPEIAWVSWGVGLGVGATGLIWPVGLRWLYLGLTRVTYPLGLAVSSLVLAAVYYAVLTPLGLVLRLGGHDPLRRRFDRAATTYWQNRAGPRDPETYFRQS